MKRLLVCTGVLTVWLATPTVATELKLKSLQVAKTLNAGVPYAVAMPYTLEGSIKDVEACFWWSSEGPYCFPNVTVGKNGFTIKLRTGNSGRYKLSGSIRYAADGKRGLMSNRVSANINVQ